MIFFFFFQAEDGIRDHCVTGVQTCALPICPSASQSGGPPTRSSTSTWPPTPSTAGTGAPAAASAASPSASTSAGYGQRLTTTSRPSASRPRTVLQMYPPLRGWVVASRARPGGQSASCPPSSSSWSRTPPPGSPPHHTEHAVRFGGREVADQG